MYKLTINGKDYEFETVKQVAYEIANCLARAGAEPLNIVIQLQK